MIADLSKITRDGKALFLAYDQGMEHGPVDFDDENIDPNHILSIGVEGGFTAVILQKGVAEKYYSGLEDKLPLIVKLNGKTNLLNDEDPYSPQICTVDEALQLGAKAVGYTIYVGSTHEAKMFEEFAKIERETNEKNIPLIGWMYYGGKGAEGKDIAELTAYAARLGLEMGADMVKIKYPGSPDALKRAVDSAGEVEVVVSGGPKQNEAEFLKIVRVAMDSGAAGMAVGRNIWQAEDPLGLTEKVKEIIWPDESR